MFIYKFNDKIHFLSPMIKNIDEKWLLVLSLKKEDEK